MDLHEAHKARLARMQPPRKPHPVRRVFPAIPRLEERPPLVFRLIEVIDEAPPPTTKYHWRDIVMEVAKKHKITLPEITGRQRQHKIVLARHEAFYRLKTETPLSLPEIGRKMGGRDHTSVLHGYRAHMKREGIE